MDCHTSPTAEHLHLAHKHLRLAAQAWTQQVLGHATTGHLRQAARSVLSAGLAAIDDAERRCGEASGHTQAGEKTHGHAHGQPSPSVAPTHGPTSGQPLA